MSFIRTFIGVVLVVAGAGAAVAEPAPVPTPPDGFDFKRPLTADDLARKSERSDVTGLPLANFDPNSGFGGGARAYYYFNGDRTDPLFAYTPYLHRVFLQLFYTTGGLQFHWLDYDGPAIAGTPFRIRAQLIYQRNTAQQFYGAGSASMGRLGVMGAVETFDDYGEYRDELEAVRPDGTTLARYDEYDFRRPFGLASVERTFARGLVRAFLGVGVGHATLDDYTGKTVDAADGQRATMGTTRLAQACAAGAIGCDGGWDNFVRFGVSLDTRDYEPDPNSGVFLDADIDLAGAHVGGDYGYARVLVAARGYYSPLPDKIDLVLGARGTFQWQSAGTPLFSLNTLSYTEDTRNGLGGIRTLRGYRQDRFVGNVLTLLNLEARWTFYRFRFLKQKFALIAAPFVDVGRVYDDVDELSLNNWRRGQGAALRVSWNLATIVTVDYGFSSEDAGLYINFSHQF